MTGTKIWYITGASKGMGFAVAQQLLIKGHCVAATSRSVSSLEPLFQYGEKFLPLEVDLKKESSIAQSLKTTYEKFGRLDVVVNNAGYGLGGALEELTSEEINDNFEVNFFAVVKVLQQALPYLRDQRSGHIINISSIAGFAPGTGWSMYSATKFAVSGLSEALSNDLKPFGIHVTNVLPGWFRTNFANTDSIAYNKSSIKDYDYIREAHERMNTLNGNQPGDPDEIADVFLEVVNNPAPAVNLFLGSDSFNRAQSKIEQLSQEMSRWKDISFSTDFPG